MLPLFCLIRCSLGAEPADTLAIVDAGVQQSEDAPFVTTDYQFLPGEYVYVTFHVAGYSVQLNAGKDLRSIDLTFELTPTDAQGVPLVSPLAGEIKTQLGAEDKNWTPSKELSFLIPSFVVDGKYSVHLSVKDLLASKETAQDLSFHIRGPRISPSDGISVQNFRFLRQEGANEALDIAAYSPGDTVFSDFDLSGFALAEGNQYKVAYGISVLRPDGKTFLDQPDAAELSDHGFYPARFLPCNLNVITKASSPRGEYTILLTVRDLVSGKSAVTRRTFSLE